MKKIVEIKGALKIFEESAQKHQEATDVGDYKTANKNYDSIIIAVKYLKEHNLIDDLLPYLNSQSIAVKLWASTFLLPYHESDAISALKDLIKVKGIISLDAETVLVEWERGNLKV